MNPLALPATLHHDEAAAFALGLSATMRALPVKAADGALGFVVDASALTAFDSSALAVLLECRRVAIATGQVFSVSGAPARLAQLATLYGVAELFPSPSVRVED